MSKVAVVFYSSTGNTQAMADAVVAGAQKAGAEVELMEADQFSSARVSEFDAIAFGCPAMGNEVLEEGVFEPMFAEVEGSLSGKKIGLFGSYDWGDGEWMRSWYERCLQAGAAVVSEGVIANLEPGDAELAECEELGKSLA